MFFFASDSHRVKTIYPLTYGINKYRSWFYDTPCLRARGTIWHNSEAWARRVEAMVLHLTASQTPDRLQRFSKSGSRKEHLRCQTLISAGIRFRLATGSLWQPSGVPVTCWQPIFSRYHWYYSDITAWVISGLLGILFETSTLAVVGPSVLIQ